MLSRRSYVGRRVRHLSFALAVVCSFFFYAAYAQSQEGKTPREKQDKDEVITVTSNLVNIDVTVRDKKGRPVIDLKPEDFTIFENGVQQKIDFFDHPLNREGGNSGAGNTGDLASTGSTPQVPKGRGPRNIIFLVLDGQTTEASNMRQVREGVIKYIREQITDTDMVGLFAVTGGLQLLAPFTNDRPKLISAVETSFGLTSASKVAERREVGEAITEQIGVLRDNAQPQVAANLAPPNFQAQVATMIASQLLRQFVSLRAQLSLQQSQPILAALGAICEALRLVPGKKTVVLFSQGFITSETQDWQVQRIVDLANRADVAIYIIDATGLTGGVPKSGAYVPPGALDAVSGINSLENRVQAVGGETIFDNARHEGSFRERDILYRLSEDTGGKFIKGTNDIASGLNRIDHEIRSRYTLGYYSTDPNFDGSFRKLKVEVHRPGARVLSRAGFHAIAHDTTLALSPAGRKPQPNDPKISSPTDPPNIQLLALFKSLNIEKELPLTVFLGYGQAKGKTALAAAIQIEDGPVNGDAASQKGRNAAIDILCGVSNSEGNSVAAFKQRISVARSASPSVPGGTTFNFTRHLPPGRYHVRVAAMDMKTRKVGSATESIEIPDIGPKAFSLSTVYTGEVIKDTAEPGSPSQASRIRWVRRFARSSRMQLLTYIYNASHDRSSPNVGIQITISRNGQPVATTPELEVPTDKLTDAANIPYSLDLPLQALPPGDYVLEFSAVDHTSNAKTAQQIEFTVFSTNESVSSIPTAVAREQHASVPIRPADIGPSPVQAKPQAQTIKSSMQAGLQPGVSEGRTGPDAGEGAVSESPKPTLIKENASNQSPLIALPARDGAGDGDVLRVETTLVTVPARVVDRKRRLMLNLGRQDFHIYQNGLEQEIAQFGTVDEPITVALLLDTSASTRPQLKGIQDAAIAFVKGLRPQDHVIVISFDTAISLVAEGTGERDRIAEAIRKLHSGSGTRLYDAVDAALNRYLIHTSTRKAIVLFTDGQDTASYNATSKMNLHGAESSSALIYTIMYGSVLDSITDTPRLYLGDLAQRTGGRFYRAGGLTDLTKAFALIAEELHEQYSLSYYPKTAPVAGQRYTISVTVNRPDLKVFARNSYVQNSTSRPSN